MTGFIPVSGATNVTSGQGTFQIIADFSQPLDPSKVNISSFLLRLSGSSTNLSGIAFRDSIDTTRAIFVPTSGIFRAQTPSTGASYIPIILGSGSAVGVRNLEGFFAATVSGSFVTAGILQPTDTVAPVVSGTSPVSGATQYAISGKPIIKFSEAIVSGTMSGQIKIIVSGAGSDTPSTLALTDDRFTVTITPTSNLSGGTVYNGHVNTGVTDLAGNAIAASYRWSFTTFTPAPPTISGTTPTDGAVNITIDTDPVIVFNTPMQSGSFSGQIKLFVSGIGSPITNTLSVSSNLTTVKISPNADLSHCKLYVGFVNNTVKEQFGISPLAASYSWSFNTECPGAPVVITTNPLSGATNVDLSIKPTITFNKRLASSTVSTNTIHLRVSGLSTDIASTVTLSSNLLSVEISPESLSYFTTYRGFVDNTVTEEFGVIPMVASFTWSFQTTEPAYNPIYNITQTGVNSRNIDGGTQAIGIKVLNSGVLLGHTVRKVTVVLSRTGTPQILTPARVVIRAGGTSDTITLGTIPISSIPTDTFSSFTLTNLSANYAFQQNDTITIEQSGCTASGYIGVAVSTNTAPAGTFSMSKRSGTSNIFGLYVVCTAGIIYELA